MVNPKRYDILLQSLSNKYFVTFGQLDYDSLKINYFFCTTPLALYIV